MKTKHVVKFILGLLQFHYIFLQAYASIPVSDTYRSSLCYDIHGRANVNLRCPQGYHIRTLTSFTGISRYKACSYRAWDCVVKEGTMERCDNQTSCTVNVNYSDTQKTSLSCGNEGETKYFQIEYECTPTNGHHTASSAQPTTIYPKLGQPGITPNEAQDKGQGKSQNSLSSRLTLVAIVCGSAIAILFVIAVMATLAHRIKKRTESDSSLYGPLGAGIVGRSLSHCSTSTTPSHTSNQYSLATSRTSCLSNESHTDNAIVQFDTQPRGDRFSHPGSHFVDNQRIYATTSSYESPPSTSPRYPQRDM